MNRKSAVKTAARAALQCYPFGDDWAGDVIDVVEEIDRAEFADLSFTTLEGAVRAAARDLGRYDADADEITPTH